MDLQYNGIDPPLAKSEPMYLNQREFRHLNDIHLIDCICISVRHSVTVKLQNVLVSTGTELIIFIVSVMMLCFGFGRKTVDNTLMF